MLIANERKDRLALVAPIVAALGHEVIAREIEVEDVGAVTVRERPDVALVGLGESSEHALGLIEKIVKEAACPVIVLLHAPAPEFVKEASKRGVFAYITDADAKDWQSSIDIVLRRFAEYHDLEGAFGRRAVTERAKGILMERHSIDEANAFAMLRDHSRDANRKLIDVAMAVVDGHRLLPNSLRRSCRLLHGACDAAQRRAERAPRSPPVREQQHARSAIAARTPRRLAPTRRGSSGRLATSTTDGVALAQPVGHEPRQHGQARAPGHDHEHARRRRGAPPSITRAAGSSRRRPWATVDAPQPRLSPVTPTSSGGAGDLPARSVSVRLDEERERAPRRRDVTSRGPAHDRLRGDPERPGHECAGPRAPPSVTVTRPPRSRTCTRSRAQPGAAARAAASGSRAVHDRDRSRLGRAVGDRRHAAGREHLEHARARRSSAPPRRRPARRSPGRGRSLARQPGGRPDPQRRPPLPHHDRQPHAHRHGAVAPRHAQAAPQVCRQGAARGRLGIGAHRLGARAHARGVAGQPARLPREDQLPGGEHHQEHRGQGAEELDRRLPAFRFHPLCSRSAHP